MGVWAPYEKSGTSFCVITYYVLNMYLCEMILSSPCGRNIQQSQLGSFLVRSVCNLPSKTVKFEGTLPITQTFWDYKGFAELN